MDYPYFHPQFHLLYFQRKLALIRDQNCFLQKPRQFQYDGINFELVLVSFFLMQLNLIVLARILNFMMPRLNTKNFNHFVRFVKYFRNLHLKGNWQLAEELINLAGFIISRL